MLCRFVNGSKPTFLLPAVQSIMLDVADDTQGKRLCTKCPSSDRHLAGYLTVTGSCQEMLCCMSSGHNLNNLKSRPSPKDKTVPTECTALNMLYAATVVNCQQHLENLRYGLYAGGACVMLSDAAHERNQSCWCC